MNIDTIFAFLKANPVIAGSLIGVASGFCGLLFATVIKDFAIPRAFESWKDKRAVKTLIRKHLNPMVLVLDDLDWRLLKLTSSTDKGDYYRSLFTSDYLAQIFEDPADVVTNRTYYKPLSTAFRLLALLGWFEILRRESVHLENWYSKKAYFLIKEIQDLIANGEVGSGPSENIIELEHTIFTEEQRALGEFSISTLDSSSVMGYLEFQKRLEKLDGPLDRSYLERLFSIFRDCGTGSERIERLRLLKKKCRELRKELRGHRSWRQKLANRLMYISQSPISILNRFPQRRRADEPRD